MNEEVVLGSAAFVISLKPAPVRVPILCTSWREGVSGLFFHVYSVHLNERCLPDSPPLYSPAGLLAFSPLQASDWPQSPGSACSWAPAEATTRKSHPRQTTDLCPLHKPPQVSLPTKRERGRPSNGLCPLLEWMPCHWSIQSSPLFRDLSWKLPLWSPCSLQLLCQERPSPLTGFTQQGLHDAFICSLSYSCNRFLLGTLSVPVDTMPTEICVCLSLSQDKGPSLILWPTTELKKMWSVSPIQTHLPRLVSH